MADDNQNNGMIRRDFFRTSTRQLAALALAAGVLTRVIDQKFIDHEVPDPIVELNKKTGIAIKGYTTQVGEEFFKNNVNISINNIRGVDPVKKLTIKPDRIILQYRDGTVDNISFAAVSGSFDKAPDKMNINIIVNKQRKGINLELDDTNCPYPMELAIQTITPPAMPFHLSIDAANITRKTNLTLRQTSKNQPPVILDFTARAQALSVVKEIAGTGMGR